MAYYARLQHGEDYIDLTTGNYALSSSFVPPATNTNVQMSTGNMSNRRGGGRKISEQSRDREFDLPLRITGDSGAETHGAVRRLVNFINNALEDKSEKLYFVYGYSNAIPYEPKYGQLFEYYEIKSFSDAALGARYNVAEKRNKSFEIEIPLTIAPFAEGARQRVGSATGSILEHDYATPDGSSRGMIVPVTDTNEVANPIFGNSTWNSGYTAGADIIETQNTDEEFILFGSSSAKLTAIGATNNYYRVSVTCAASTFCFSCFAKKEDGSAVTTADIPFFTYNASGVDLNFKAEGNGWYRVWGTDTGTGGAANLDIKVLNTKTVYIDMVCAEAGSYPTSPFYGDMLDCSWAGTAHASDSTRTTARWRVAASDTINPAQGSLRIVWTPPIDSTTYAGATRRIFWTDSTKLRGSWTTTNALQLNDGTNSVSSSNQTWANGDQLILTFVWGPGRLECYINGTSVASGSTYTPFALGTNLYIGSNATPTEHSEGTYSDLVTWDEMLSDTEVLNDANDLTNHINGGDGLGQAFNPIPWRWSDDGDDVLDMYYDATHEDFFVVGGVPGDTQAATLYEFAVSTAGNDLVFSNLPYKEYMNPSLIFDDRSGHADAGALGGEVEQVTVGTSGSTAIQMVYSSIAEPYRNLIKSVLSSKFTIFTSLSDADSGLTIAPYFSLGGSSYYGDARPIAADATRKNFYTYSLTTPFDITSRYDWYAPAPLITFMLFLDRVSGSATVEVDWLRIMLGDFMYVPVNHASTTIVFIEGKTGYGYQTGGGGILNEILHPLGDNMDLYPGKLNHIIALSGDHGANTSLTATVTINRMYVTPRWNLV